MTDFARSFTMTLDTLAIAEPCSMRPLVADCHLCLGKLYRGVASASQAQQHITTAATMYREMNMRFWPGQSAKEIGELA